MQVFEFDNRQIRVYKFNKVVYVSFLDLIEAMHYSRSQVKLLRKSVSDKELSRRLVFIAENSKASMWLVTLAGINEFIAAKKLIKGKSFVNWLERRVIPELIDQEAD